VKRTLIAAVCAMAAMTGPATATDWYAIRRLTHQCFPFESPAKYYQDLKATGYSPVIEEGPPGRVLVMQYPEDTHGLAFYRDLAACQRDLQGEATDLQNYQ
jgi:hypothetical protein